MYKIEKARRTIYDLLLALAIIAFILLVMLSPTLGHSQFYGRFITNDAEITASLQSSLKEKTDSIADKTGIAPEAFDFAVGSKKVSVTQKEISNAIFAGINYDYSDSASIRDCYHDGITEYYRYNGLELDVDALERAVPMACAAFNETYGISNNKEMNEMIRFMSRYSIVLAVAALVLGALIVLKIFTIYHGRTRVFSHYGSALLCAGNSAILIGLSNFVVHYGNRLYLTDSFAFNKAFSGASNVYFMILILFGIAFDVAGISMIRYVDTYYKRKMDKQKQEHDINRSLYVKRFDGEDKTVGEIVDNRRKDYGENDTN